MTKVTIYNGVFFCWLMFVGCNLLLWGPFRLLLLAILLMQIGLLTIFSSAYCSHSRIAEELTYLANTTWKSLTPQYEQVNGWIAVGVGLSILALFPSNVLAAAEALGVHWVVVPTGVLAWAAGVYWALQRGARLER